MGEPMIQKFQKLFFLWIILHGAMVQSLDQMIHDQLAADLLHVKKQIKNIQLEPITFEVPHDGAAQKFFQRHGFLVRRDGALGTVLICHGYLGCKRDAIALKHLFPHYNVMTFDFRAHGENRQGQVSTIGRDEAFDVIAAVNFIKSDPLMRHLPVIAFGYSMGAVSAIQAQAMDNSLFAAMILDCPYDSTDDAMRRGLEDKMKFTIFGRTFSIPGQQFLLDHMYDEYAQMITNFLFKRITALDSKSVATKFVRVSPIESIRAVTVPCYFIHCENDKKVPIHAIERLYENKPGFKRLWITQGKQHFGSYIYNPELYAYKVMKFLTKLQTQDINNRVQERILDQRTRKNPSQQECSIIVAKKL